MILAGLLTYSIFELPSRSFKMNSGLSSVQRLWRAYSSGSVQDLHLIPFSFLHYGYSKEHQNPKAKLGIYFKYHLLNLFFILSST